MAEIDVGSKSHFVATSNPKNRDEVLVQELLARIGDTRSSEKVFWRRVLDIYATNIEQSKIFFAIVQNKMHRAVPSSIRKQFS